MALFTLRYSFFYIRATENEVYLFQQIFRKNNDVSPRFYSVSNIASAERTKSLQLALRQWFRQINPCAELIQYRMPSTTLETCPINFKHVVLRTLFYKSRRSENFRAWHCSSHCFNADVCYDEYCSHKCNIIQRTNPIEYLFFLQF